MKALLYNEIESTSPGPSIIIITILLLLINAGYGFSQDTIYRINGTVLTGKVVEVNEKMVTIKSDSILKTVSANTIGFIKYSNGTKEEFNINRLDNYLASHSLKKDFEKNIIAFYPVAWLLQDINLSYERIFRNGMASVKIPFSYSLNGSYDTTQYISEPRDRPFNWMFTKNKIVSGGLEINFYPTGQSKNVVYFGLSAIIGSFNYYNTLHDTLSSYNSNNILNYSYPLRSATKYTGVQYAYMVHLGGHLTANDILVFGAKVGFGYRKEDTIFFDHWCMKAQVALSMGVKF
jgi:hypothetical protein